MFSKTRDKRIMEYFKEFYLKNKNDFFENQRQTDRIVVWLFGISSSAIALILFQTNNTKAIEMLNLKFAVACLVLTLIFGVIYRACYYRKELLESLSLIEFEAYCAIVTSEVYGPLGVNDMHTIPEIAEKLKTEMGYDCTRWLQSNLPREFWVKSYNDWADFWRKSEEAGLKALGRAFSKVANVSEEIGEKILMDNKKENKKNKINVRTVLTFLCEYSYYLMLLTFILSAISLFIGFASIKIIN